MLTLNMITMPRIIQNFLPKKQKATDVKAYQVAENVSSLSLDYLLETEISFRRLTMILSFSWTLRMNNTGFIGTLSTQYFSLLVTSHAINFGMFNHMTSASQDDTVNLHHYQGIGRYIFCAREI